MSDVTAVVLSIGETYTSRAIAAVERQTLPVAETVVVRGVSPFHRALNSGASRVRTPLFAQVDADMILDATCLEELRARMSDGIGLVSGLLRDPLVGRTHGVRLYRSECFERVQIRDSISPDMDFGADIARHGWIRLHALRHQGQSAEERHTFGDHRPDYTPHYTFCKFLLEGVRCRYRRREGRVVRIFQQLRASDHAVAMIALIAVSHGLFLRERRDLLVPYERTPEFAWLEAFLAEGNGDEIAATVEIDAADHDLGTRFRRAYQQGVSCRQRGAASTLVAQLHALKARGGLGSWIAAVGMCHGLFHDHYRVGDANEAFASLAEILTESVPW